MTLDRTRSQSPGARAPYCVLDCEENLESSTSSRVRISNLRVFKKVSHAFSDNDSSEKGNLVASLTRNKPTISLVLETSKVEGLLEAKRSTIHIDMFHEADCLAAYTCEVQTVDSSGNIFTSVNRLRQQKIQNENQDLSSALTASVSVQLLSLTHQLDTKLALLSQSSTALQEKMNLVERRLEGRMWSIGERFNNIEPRLEIKFQSLEKGLDSLRDQMRCNIYSPDVNTLGKQEDKMDKRYTKPKDVEKGEKDTQNLLKLEEVENQITEVNNVLRSVKKDLIQMHLLQKQDHGSLENLVSETTKVSDSCNEFQQIVKNSSSFDLKNKSAEIFSYIQDSYSDTIANSVRSSMADLLLTKICKRGVSSGILYSSYPYSIVLPTKESGLAVPHLCDTVTDGGGWIIIHRRRTGNVDFYRDWNTYKQGFGSIEEDFWIGNENIHKLTSQGVYELRIEIKYKGRSSYASYDRFVLGNEQSKYTIKVGRYSGTAGDSLEVHNGEPFSTYDRDHDLYDRNCAVVFSGAWWYKACHHSNLNGKWQATAYKGPAWQTLTNGDPVSYSEMKIRRIDEP
ncbi:fibrinogen-related protein 3.2 [Elysia marginata]|uniref:Fibrinogen-related protein 3.2 n=1 Tax=Elysia marginata TaxID=1093978 RepID=A0AAV4FF26_9GAST|nr:fibrinogen-related protein 3.2 [Elysia marginata]